MANLLKRGDTCFVRLMIPRNRWADIGRAMGARGGIRWEVVRTLQTTNFREAQRRREEGLRAAREMIDDALKRHRLKPLRIGLRIGWGGPWNAEATCKPAAERSTN